MELRVGEIEKTKWIDGYGFKHMVTKYSDGSVIVKVVTDEWSKSYSDHGYAKSDKGVGMYRSLEGDERKAFKEAHRIAIGGSNV